MLETVLKNEAKTYFDTLDEKNMQVVISYMKTLDSSQKEKRSLADLKGKIQFADGYDYKAMRNEK